MRRLHLFLLSAVLLAGPALPWLCRGVDPLPVELRDAPLEKRMEYLEKRGEESKRLREIVAQERFAEQQRFIQSVATGMQQELADQQSRLRGETAVTPETPGSAPAADADELSSDKISHQLAISALILGALVVLYHFRDRLFPRLYGQ